MDDLKNEINEMLEIFNIYEIPVETQRYIITHGVYFDFAYGPDRSGINRNFDCFKFSRFLKFCINSNFKLNANEMIRKPWDSEYMDLIHLFDKMDKLSMERSKLK